MKASWEKLEKNEGILHIEVDKERVVSRARPGVSQSGEKRQVPGFGEGKFRV